MKKNFLLVSVMLSVVFLFSGCGFSKNYYNDDEAMSISDNGGSMKMSNQNIDANNNIVYTVGKLDGFVALGEVSVPSETKPTMHFSITAKSGKAKLVLLRPDLKVEVLKEIIADKDGSFNGDVSFVCPKGVCKLKMIGDNFSGNCVISNMNVLFKKTTWEREK